MCSTLRQSWMPRGSLTSIRGLVSLISTSADVWMSSSSSSTGTAFHSLWASSPLSNSPESLGSPRSISTSSKSSSFLMASMRSRRRHYYANGREGDQGLSPQPSTSCTPEVILGTLWWAVGIYRWSFKSRLFSCAVGGEGRVGRDKNTLVTISGYTDTEWWEFKYIVCAHECNGELVWTQCVGNSGFKQFLNWKRFYWHQFLFPWNSKVLKFILCVYVSEWVSEWSKTGPIIFIIYTLWSNIALIWLLMELQQDVPRGKKFAAKNDYSSILLFLSLKLCFSSWK